MAIKRCLIALALGLVVAVALLWALDGFPARRVHAASLSVTTHDDALNGDGLCSLREAIHAANADARPWDNRIARRASARRLRATSLHLARKDAPVGSRVMDARRSQRPVGAGWR